MSSAERLVEGHRGQNVARVIRLWTNCMITLESGIDVGQGITVGPGKFVKKNKCRALNKLRA